MFSDLLYSKLYCFVTSELVPELVRVRAVPAGECAGDCQTSVGSTRQSAGRALQRLSRHS